MPQQDITTPYGSINITSVQKPKTFPIGTIEIKSIQGEDDPDHLLRTPVAGELSLDRVFLTPDNRILDQQGIPANFYQHTSSQNNQNDLFPSGDLLSQVIELLLEYIDTVRTKEFFTECEQDDIFIRYRKAYMKSIELDEKIKMLSEKLDLLKSQAKELGIGKDITQEEIRLNDIYDK